MTKLVYLGTSGAMPTIDRGLSCTVLDLGKEYAMIDCGDGSCRQYLNTYLKWNKPTSLFITHMHSDHTMGIMGLLQSMDLMGRTEPLTIYGIRGIRKFVYDLHRGANFKFGFEFEIHELDERIDNSITLKSGTIVTTCRTKHQVPSMAYKFTLPDREGTLDIEKCKELGVPEGKLLGELKKGNDVEFQTPSGLHIVTSKFVVGEPSKGIVVGFSGDTRPIPALIPFFKDCDYLTFETTFRSDELELAKKSKHSTAKEVGELCEEAKVKNLFCNHFSARHSDVRGFKTDIKEYFGGKITLTKDFLVVDLQG